MICKAWLSLCLAVLLSPVAAAATAPQSEQELLERFMQGRAAHDFEAIAELINWEGVSRYKRRIIRGYTRATFGREVLDARFEPADTEALADFVVGKRRYGSNHPVSSLLRLELANPVSTAQGDHDTVIFMVGEQADGYRIAIAVPPAGSPPPDND